MQSRTMQKFDWFRSRRLAVVEVEHATQPLTAVNASVVHTFTPGSAIECQYVAAGDERFKAVPPVLRQRLVPMEDSLVATEAKPATQRATIAPFEEHDEYGGAANDARK